MRYRRHRYVGECIRVARERKGLTAAELAKRIDVHRSTVARWESGRSKMGKTFAPGAFALCKVLGLDVRALAFDRCECNQIYIPWMYEHKQTSRNGAYVLDG